MNIEIFIVNDESLYAHLKETAYSDDLCFRRLLSFQPQNYLPFLPILCSLLNPTQIPLGSFTNPMAKIFPSRSYSFTSQITGLPFLTSLFSSFFASFTMNIRWSSST